MDDRYRGKTSDKHSGGNIATSDRREDPGASKYSLYGIFYGTRANACVRRLVHGAVFRVLKLNAQVSSR